MECKQIRLYDSLGGLHEQLLTNLLRYLRDELLDKHEQHLDMMAWQCCPATDIPAQTNGVDCGVFTCKYIQHILTGRDFCWDQSHMAFFRQRMVLEILDQKIHWLHEEVGTQMPVTQMASREDKEEASTQQYTDEQEEPQEETADPPPAAAVAGTQTPGGAAAEEVGTDLTVTEVNMMEESDENNTQQYCVSDEDTVGVQNQHLTRMAQATGIKPCLDRDSFTRTEQEEAVDESEDVLSLEVEVADATPSPSALHQSQSSKQCIRLSRHLVDFSQFGQAVWPGRCGLSALLAASGPIFSRCGPSALPYCCKAVFFQVRAFDRPCPTVGKPANAMENIECPI